MPGFEGVSSSGEGVPGSGEGVPGSEKPLPVRGGALGSETAVSERDTGPPAGPDTPLPAAFLLSVSSHLSSHHLE